MKTVAIVFAIVLAGFIATPLSGYVFERAMETICSDCFRHDRQDDRRERCLKLMLKGYGPEECPP